MIPSDDPAHDWDVYWAEWREDLAALLAAVSRTEKQAYMERRGIRGDGAFLSERIAIDFERRARGCEEFE